MKSLLTQSRTAINGDKFLICYLLLLATPFWFCLLPLLILTAPMRLMWAKERGRVWWRVGSSLWLVISMIAAMAIAMGTITEQNGITLYSFPLRYPMDSMYGDEFIPIGWVEALNMSLIAGLLMLPLSAASLIEARMRLKS